MDTTHVENERDLHLASANGSVVQAGLIPTWIGLAGGLTDRTLQLASSWAHEVRTEIYQVVGAAIDVGELAGKSAAKIARGAAARTDELVGELIRSAELGSRAAAQALQITGEHVTQLAARVNGAAGGNGASDRAA